LKSLAAGKSVLILLNSSKSSLICLASLADNPDESPVESK
jgi:hypothetical protein